MSKDLREQSRHIWTSTGEKLTIEEVSLGVQLRIADSLERMEKPYLKMIDENAYLRKRVQALNEELTRSANTNRALRGHITRLKKKEAANG